MMDEANAIDTSKPADPEPVKIKYPLVTSKISSECANLTLAVMRNSSRLIIVTVISAIVTYRMDSGSLSGDLNSVRSRSESKMEPIPPAKIKSGIPHSEMVGPLIITKKSARLTPTVRAIDAATDVKISR